jgi:demethylmenaquinone methyltransferase/2-methoxy-6-polyprenyl-1,4-benzoquinol methylase
MNDGEDYIRKMAVSNPLIEPTASSAIQSLRLPSGSSGLDAGCGIGLQTLLLAEAVGPDGHVTGLDISPEFLLHAESILQDSPLSERISFREGDVSALPFESRVFDWAWSSCCVGYAAMIEPLSALKELARVVKPCGSVALFAWSSEKLLPGYPLLEARLNATSSGIAPFRSGMQPDRHFSRALGWYRDAGLVELTARTFAGDVHAPLSEKLRNALQALFEMRWPGAEAELAEEDRPEYRRLCRPDSPGFILNHLDYYAFFTFSLFCGRVAG